LDWLNEKYSENTIRQYEAVVQELHESDTYASTLNLSKPVESGTQLKRFLKEESRRSVTHMNVRAIKNLLLFLQELTDSNKKERRLEMVASEFDSLMDECENANQLGDSFENRRQRIREKLIPEKHIHEVFDSSELRLELVVRFLLETGCRRSEAAAVRFNDIELDSESPASVHLQRKYSQNADNYIETTLKVRDSRTVCGSEKTRSLLSQIKSGKSLKDDDFVFGPGENRSICYRRLGESVSWAFEELSSFDRGVEPHDFRHTLATRIVKSVGVMEAREYLGHRNLEGLRVYTHLEVDDDVVPQVADLFE